MKDLALIREIEKEAWRVYLTQYNLAADSYERTHTRMHSNPNDLIVPLSRPLARAVRWACWVVLVAATHGQTPLSLEEAGRRKPQDLSPLHEGREVVIHGVVSSKPVLFEEHAHLPVRDESNSAMTLEAPDFMFERLAVGERLEVRGIVGQRGGVPVLRPVQLRTVGHTDPPRPAWRRIEQLQTPAAVGVVAMIEGRVMALGEDTGGEYLLLEGGQPVPYPVYLSRVAQRFGTGLGRFRVGDRVKAIGLASQASYDPPHTGKFRMVVPDAASLDLIERNWFVTPQTLMLGVISLMVLALWVYRRNLRSSMKRRTVRRVHGFCEELLTATTPEEVLRKLRTLGPRALQVSSLELYRFDRPAQALRPLIGSRQSEDIPASLDGTDRSIVNPVAVCFRNRTPLNITDTRRSPLVGDKQREKAPRSMVLLPMVAREEMVGVLEIAQQDFPRMLGHEELAAMQHLANQVAMVLKLLEQQARRDQIMRSEKLAATGQILSGVAGELKAPLESILSQAHRLLENGDGEARAILNESLKAASILTQLSRVMDREEGEVTPVEMNGLLQRLLEPLEKDWKQQELRLELQWSRQPLWVLGQTGQLEQVLKNLILLAARSARSSLDRSLRIETAVSSKRVMVSVRYGALLCDESFAPGPGTLPYEQEALGFGVCRGILHGLGGDVRIATAGESSCRVEIELPAAFPALPSEPAPRPAAGSSRPLTALLLEPDSASARRLVSYWSSNGHRAVPVHNEAEAFELLRRLRIDVVFSAVRVGTTNWVDLFDRLRDQVPAFVLLTEGLESEVSMLFPQGEGFVLRKPMETGEIERLIERIQQRVDAASPAASR
ncbi:MAG: GAF domain-containing protein [Acidobacteria bacterium]|nr:GAF domain-containing protein [Acidobacteriota bacterium]